MTGQQITYMDFDELEASAVDAVQAMEPVEHFERYRAHLPTHAEIANRAYDIYLQSGRIVGRDDQNWEQAEQELMVEHFNRSTY